MITKIINGRIISDGKIIENKALYIKDNYILDISENNMQADSEIDAKGNYISPGFIDMHTHGGGNSDFMDGTTEAFINAAHMHAIHGSTTIIPTTLSGNFEETKTLFEIFNKVQNTEYNGANMPGLHLEGPYFALSQKGAQDPKYIRSPKYEEYEEVLSWSDKIVCWSSAPELEGSSEFAKSLKKRGIIAAIGHTDADYDDVAKAYQQGFSHLTHLYSCMTSVHRKNAFRYAGAVEAAYLIDGLTVEIITDGIHLPPPLLEMVYRFIGPDRVALITDSMRGAGMGDGESILGSLKSGQKVLIEDGVAKLLDRSAFAGSVATMDRAVRTMYKYTSADICNAIKMATETPAKILGFDKKGKLKPGYDADIVIFDEDINIKTTIVNGNIIVK